MDVRPAPPTNIGGNENIPEYVNDKRNDLQSLRSELSESRQAVVEGLDVDATPAERRAAMAEWQSANADLIAAADALSSEIRDAIRENRPDTGEDAAQRRQVPEAVASSQELRNELQSGLAADHTALTQDLREQGKTPEEIAAAVAVWREQNSAIIAEIEGLNEEIAEWAQTNRPDRPTRPETPEEADRRAEFQQNARELGEARKELGQDMRGAANPEERQAMMEEFRQDQREKMEEQKELRRQQRAGGQSDAGTSRRPGE